MNSNCPVCGVPFEPEPGFYQGAMFVSYALSVVYIAAISFSLFIFGVSDEWTYIGACIGVLLLLTPFTFRYSRILFLHFFGGIKFDHNR